jgi:hypothetical protein
VANGIHRAFTRGTDGGNANVDRILPIPGARRERPSTGTGGCGGARPDVTHAPVLRAAGVDLCPAAIRRFIELQGAVIDDDAACRSGRIGQRRTRRINLAALTKRSAHPTHPPCRFPDG